MLSKRIDEMTQEELIEELRELRKVRATPPDRKKAKSKKGGSKMDEEVAAQILKKLQEDFNIEM